MTKAITKQWTQQELLTCVHTYNHKVQCIILPPHRKNMNKSYIDKSFIAYYFSYSVFYNTWVHTNVCTCMYMSHDIFCTRTYNVKHVQCMPSLIIIISVYTCTCIYLLNVLTFNSTSNNIIYY